MVKKLLRQIIASILAWQVRRLSKKNSFRTVAVVGSVGKSSTKRAVAQYLSSSCRVQYQEGNYNDLITVPLVYFGLSLPGLFNPFAWLVAFFRIEKQIASEYPFDVVILELGTDGPGQIDRFASYVQPDVSIVTSIAPEHMEFFGSLDAVAEEELSVASFSHKLIVNTDDTPKKYLSQFDYDSYGTTQDATIQVKSQRGGSAVSLIRDDKEITVKTNLIGTHSKMVLAAAYLVGEVLGLNIKSPESGLATVSAMPGRMQLLSGIHGSTIIDDTYNASPEAVIAALNSLYDMDAARRIAVLGNMNEMGGFSKSAHEQVAQYCNPEKLDELVVIGHEAELFLASKAKQKGNKVTVFKSPYDIGAYLVKRVERDTVVLLKGSQNGVFLEEAIKPLLLDQADLHRLVRQSPNWIKKKSRQFLS